MNIDGRISTDSDKIYKKSVLIRPIRANPCPISPGLVISN
jgi:hypothetical protein